MRALSILMTAAVCVAASAVCCGTRRALAQSMPTTLVVAGLRLDAKAPNAVVTLTNTSKSSADFFSLSYQIYHEDGRLAADAVTLANPLLAGRFHVLDVAAAVNGFRAARDLGPFNGPVTLVMQGRNCAETETCPPGSVPRAFGPDIVLVSGAQTEGKATYETAVKWILPN